MSTLKDFLGGLDPAVWTDAKAGYLDDNISTKAPASTALSTATWTNTRAAAIDNLDDTVSSRAPASTALSSNVWTTTYRDRIDATISSRLGGVASQHLFTRTYQNTNSYSNWTISSVDTTKAFVTQNSLTYMENYLRIAWTMARITSSTNVQYAQAENVLYGGTVYWERPKWHSFTNTAGLALDCVSFS